MRVTRFSLDKKLDLGFVGNFCNEACKDLLAAPPVRHAGQFVKPGH